MSDVTIADLVNPKRRTGFDHVQQHNDSRKRPFRAIAYVGALTPGIKDFRANTLKWMGPWRATAQEAAQDYCDHLLGVQQAHIRRNSAGHVRVKSPKRAAARRLMAEAVSEEKRTNGFVYCISDGTALKIGKTLNHPLNRVADLQTGNPRLLKLLAYVEAEDVAVAEAEMHARFAHLSVLGEWFEHHEDILNEFAVEVSSDTDSSV